MGFLIVIWVSEARIGGSTFKQTHLRFAQSVIECSQFLRFRTDSDVLPGVERISIMLPDQSILDSVYTEMPKLPSASGVPS